MDRLAIKIAKSNKGNTSPIIVCATMFIVLAAAFAADIGYAAVQHFLLYSSVKQAAINGAEALLKNRTAAGEAVRLTVLKRAGDVTKLDTVISDNGRELTVRVKRPFSYIFVKFFGINKKEISTKITVRLSGVMSFKGTRPFGVLKGSFRSGTRCVLTNKPGNVKNSIKVVLPELGDESFKNTIILGYQRKLQIGDRVKAAAPAAAAGNMENGEAGTGQSIAAGIKEGIDSLIAGCRHEPKCTYEKYSSDCTRIIIVPVLTAADNTNLYNVSGFTAFFIEGCSTEGDSFYVTGRFIKHTVQADMSDNAEDFGLAGIRIAGS